jgi:hypothetical protein
LVKHQHEEVALDRHNVMIVGDLVETVDQQPCYVANRRVVLQGNCRLAADRRHSPIGPHD